MNFEDHFSEKAQDYARYRPSYPADLYVYLASVAPERRLAWDCGTGNGQAALGLAAHFEHVVATDASADQISHSRVTDRIDYRVEPAEKSSIQTDSVDLVTVAVAVHWFDLERFYREVRRVLKRNGILAVWTYHLPSIEREIDRVVGKYYAEVLSGYWPERIQYVHDRYQTLPFPFEELQAPEFKMEATWGLRQLLGFLDSWSGTRRFQETRGFHPIKAIWDELDAAWGEAERKRIIRWPLHLKIGKVGTGG